MKNFLKTMLASSLGFIIAWVIIVIVTVTVIVSTAAASMSGKSTASLEKNSILDIDMSKTEIAEQTLEDNPFTSLSYLSAENKTEHVRTVGILDAVNALDAAATDPNIKMVYIRPDMAHDISHLEEFREALLRFRDSGKPIYAYMETPGNAGFYLASAADRIYMSEYSGGINLFQGISGRLIFLKDLLDRLGINVQLIRHGKYKSAGEMYACNAPSKDNLEQNKAMVNALWKEIANAVASRSGMTAGQLNNLLDNLSLNTPGDFVSAGLVDGLVSYQGMKDKLTQFSGVQGYEDVKSISLADYAAIKKIETDNRNYNKDEIAVIFLDGEIIDGRGPEEVAGKAFADIIDDVRRNDNVKAVVLRVNSPGGSVVAASQIKDAVDALCAEKTVYASFGSYAASGGYWVSAGCEKIFSDATTLTGSIGVFGMIPEFSRTAKDLVHVNFVSIPSNRHADMFGMMRPLDAAEMNHMQKDINRIYDQFIGLVADGRNMTSEKVDSLGQGRVWTGREALRKGLVDEIGTLSKAVAAVADASGTYDYKVVGYPTPPTMLDYMLSAMDSGRKNDLVDICPLSGTLIKEFRQMKKPEVYARLPYCMEIR